MIDQLCCVTFVKAFDALPLVNSINHICKHQFLLGSVHECISGDEDLQRVEESGGDGCGGQGIEDHPHHGRACEVSDHLKALELDCGVQGLANKVDPG